MCVNFSKWKQGRKDRDGIELSKWKKNICKRHSDLSGKTIFVEPRYVKDSLKMKLKIIQSQVKKGSFNDYKTLNLGLLAERAFQEFLAEEHCESSVHVKSFSSNNMKVDGRDTSQAFHWQDQSKQFCQEQMLEVVEKDKCTEIQETFGKYPAFHPSTYFNILMIQS